MRIGSIRQMTQHRFVYAGQRAAVNRDASQSAHDRFRCRAELMLPFTRVAVEVLLQNELAALVQQDAVNVRPFLAENPGADLVGDFSPQRRVCDIADGNAIVKMRRY